MYKILKNIIEMDDYSVQKLSKSQPPEPFQWNTVEGTELNVDDCIGGKGKIGVKGNTYQKQLTGKNKIDLSNCITDHGITSTLKDDGSIDLKGTTTNTWFNFTSKVEIDLKAGNYVFSIDKPVNFYIKLRLFKKSNTSEYDQITINANETTSIVTLAEDYSQFYAFAHGLTVNTVIDENIKLQLEQGSTATDFEEYCGGQASPNPDYPQEIKVVTGNNLINHVGKNLWDRYNVFYYNNSTITNEGKIKNDNQNYKVYKIEGLKVGTQYTISELSPLFFSDGTATRAVALTANNSFINLLYYNNRKEAKRYEHTFVVPEKTDYILVQLRNTDENIQLEEGSVATEYEPHKENAYQLNLGNIELCKIGNYEDIPFKNEVGDENYNAELESGAWYEKKNIEKLVINGGFQSAGVPNVFYSNKIKNYAINNNIPYCEYFKGINNVTGAGGMGNADINTMAFINVSGSTTPRCYIKANKTQSELNTFLAENTPHLYYLLETPTYIKITDPTLISQLEALRKAKWFKGVNHWWTETDNLEPVLKGTYRQAINE